MGPATCVSRPAVQAPAAPGDEEEEIRGSGGERVHPGDFGESREVGVRGRDGYAMLDGEGGEACIEDEVATHVVAEHQILEHSRVTLGLHRDPDAGLCQPRPHVVPGLGGRERAVQRPRMGHDSDERPQRLPGQAHARGAVDPLLQPASRTLMER